MASRRESQDSHPPPESGFSSGLSDLGPELGSTDSILQEPYKLLGLEPRAAEAGEGVALARGMLVVDALADGRLVQPVRGRLQDRYAYHLVQGPDLTSDIADMLGDWLSTELEASSRVLEAVA